MSKWRIDSRDGAMANDWRLSCEKWKKRALAAESRVSDLEARLLASEPAQPGVNPLEQVEELLERTNLTDWECEFVDSVAKQIEAGRNLSDKQISIINRTYKQRIIEA